MKVRAFRNLTRHCYSIQARVNSGWRTVAHASAVDISGAAFKVSQAGRGRVLATGKKTVHAWIEGDLISFAGNLAPGCDASNAEALQPFRKPFEFRPVAGEAVTYNPRQNVTFVRRADQSPIGYAPRAWLGLAGVMIP